MLARMAWMEGSQPLADLCDAVERRVDVLTVRAVRAIRAEIPAYPGAVLPAGDLEATARDNLVMLLAAVRTQAPTTAEQAAALRQVAARRAAQGISADAVVHAFTIGYRELWQALHAEASAALDPGLPALLLDVVTFMFRWLQDATAAIVAAHQDASSSQQRLVAAIHQELVELLTAGDPESPAVNEAAAAVGYDPAGAFRACWSRRRPSAAAELGAVEAALARLPGRHVVASYASGLLVLGQGGEVDALTAALGEAAPTLAFGIGLERDGLRGARQSVADAQLAAGALAGGSGFLAFADGWLAALVVASREQLAPLLEPLVAVAAANPHLADAVDAYSRAGCSIAAAARQLHLHPNSVTYRLDRWRQLTGADLRTRDGLLRSCVAVDLVVPV